MFMVICNEIRVVIKNEYLGILVALAEDKKIN